MMKLHAVSHLPVDAETAWSIFESEAFRRRLAAETGIEGQIVSQQMEGPVQVTHLRYTTTTELPAVAAKALGAKHLSYEQTNRLELAAGRLQWTVRIPALGDRLAVQGVTTILPHSKGCERVVEGTIEVRVPIIGGQIEKVVGGGFEKSMERAVDVARAIAAERG